MRIFGAIVFIVLAAIAVLHLAWGFGLRWPASGERELVATVVGATGRTRMPGRAQCALAAVAILCAACVVLLLSGLVPSPLPPHMLILLGGGVASVFALRGLVAYTRGWRRRFALQPFARNDQRYYAPLCFVVALVAALLVLERMRI